MTAYYNEFDPFAAEWLRELIKAGQIAPGVVDERSVEDVHPHDLDGFSQVHLFAGIGVWSYALREIGWPDDKPIWSGSFPCQPFSAAGKGGGFNDERHLWPHGFHLITQCRPPIIVGEQVASPDGLAWLDLVQVDLEAADYAVGAVDTCAAGFGAPNIRQRLYWVADASDEGPQRHRRPEQIGHAERRSETQRHASAANVNSPTGPTNGFWRDADWLFCKDDKWRPVEPGTFPLAYGPAARVGRLRGYGNACNAEAAKAFLRAALY